MIVVMGGSLGGCDALREIFRRLPADFAAPIAVVLHRHIESEGLLAPLVQSASALPVCEAEDKMRIEPGRIYLCPPDYHLLLDGGYFSLSTDDLVNYARPSVDALFESAAEWQGPAAIGVILTGYGSDGAAGARRIVERGGRVLVQDPTTAEGLWMPTAAIGSTGTPYVLGLERIAALLTEMTGAKP